MLKNRILQLLNDNRAQAKARPPEAMLVNAEKNTATLYLYGPIVATEIEAEWYGGVSSERFVKDLAKLDPKAEVSLYINSPGGDVFAGQAMGEAIKRHAGNVTAYIDGIAASAATVPAISADRVVMGDGAFYMIHQVWTWFVGNASDMLEQAAILEKVDASLAGQYAKRTGKTDAEMLDAMKAETWYSAQEAVDAGLAHEIAAPTEEKPAAAKNASAWNLQAYAKAPPAALVAAAAPPADPVPPAQTGDTTQNNAPQPEYASDERRARLLQRARIAIACNP